MMISLRPDLHCNWWLLILLLIGSLLAGCSTSPKSRFYTLSATQKSEDLCQLEGKGMQLQTELLHFPDLLSQPQIATRPQQNRIEYAEFHRWAGSLENDFSQSLGKNLQQLCHGMQLVQGFWPDASTPEYRLYLDVSRFDGKLADSVTLSVNWMVKSREQNFAIAEQQSKIIEPVTSDGYVGLVAAQSRAVESLAREIIFALQRPE